MTNSRTLSDLRVLLLQARDTQDVEDQEQECFLERCRIERHQPPPITARFDDPRAHDLAVRPHDLAAYDGIGDDTHGGDDE